VGRKRHLGKDKLKDAYQERKAAALEALSQFQRKERDPDELLDLLTEESDRGTVILVGTWIEDLLADRIIERLPHGEENRKELLRQGGVLQSFQDKLVVGRALGVIDDEIASGLDILRHMRNACAHSRRIISFDTPELCEAYRLFFDEGAQQVMGGKTGPLFKTLFTFTAIFFFEVLTGSTVAQANRTFDTLWKNYKAEINKEVAKRRTSREKRRARSGKASPQKDRSGKAH
jgi:hypothetical protein